MSSSVPEIDLLRAYFHGELLEEEAARVRRWLVVHADLDVLTVCDAIVAERDQSRALLSACAQQPLRAKLERAVWRARSRLGTQLAALIDSNREHQIALATLGPRQAEQSTLMVPLETPLYLKLNLAVACHVTVYAIESWERLSVLLKDDGPYPAGRSIGLPGIVFERPEERVELYVILDTAAAPAVPGDEEGPAWLAQQLEQLNSSATAWLLTRTLLPIHGPSSNA